MSNDEVTAGAARSKQVRPTALLVAALVLAAAWGVWRLGAPDVVMHGAAGDAYGWDPPSITFTMRNAGFADVLVTDVGRSGPGFELVRTDGVPVLLLPGETAKVTLVYRVTDCAQVPVEPWPVPVVAGTWRGESTVYLAQGRQQRRDDLPEPQGPDVEWQEGLAAKNCALTGRS